MALQYPLEVFITWSLAVKQFTSVNTSLVGIYFNNTVGTKRFITDISWVIVLFKAMLLKF